MLAQIQVKDHEMLLLSKQNEVLQDKLQSSAVEKVSQVAKADASVSQPIEVASLLEALYKFQTSSDSVLNFNEDWQVVAGLLEQFQKQSDAVKKIEVSYSDVVDVPKEDSEIVQEDVAAEAVDDAIDKVIAGLTETEHVPVNEESTLR